ncbi:hypothetical protein HZH66_002042 [Vespula vulgaris]|uniref:Uncharacterized protein n=1 Tax=Vespula vulgaris TaxID=7454 RepID=A0A834NEV6_VESVU|nr:hypothetical protein HZH66_002042 [Vespula vulgaris]
MSMIGVIMVLAAVVWAIKLRRDIGDYLNLVVPVVAAVPCAPVYILGLKAYLCLPLATPKTKFEENNKNESDDEENSENSDIRNSDDDEDDKNNGHEANRILFLHAVLCLISGCLVAAINVACFLRSSTFQQKIREDSMIEAMENYANDDGVRSCVDAVQMEFQCCGSEDYRDWFRVSWAKVSMDYFDYEDYKRQQEGQSTKNDEARITTVKDVPFSCCTNKIVEPCGHREILQASQVCNFDPNNEETVWNVGCRSIILTHARVIGFFLIFFLLFLSLYQFILSALSRLVQTAYSNEFYIGPEKMYYRAWIFSSISSPHSKCHENLSQESDEETLETRSLVKETLESPNFRSEHKVNHSGEWKRQQEHEFVFTPRGSVQLVQIDRLRKVKSSPTLSKNGTSDINQKKSKIKTYRYLPVSTDEHDQERLLDDNKIFIEKNERSMKANLKSREKLTTKTPNVMLAPIPPPFPPQSEEYEEKRNFREKFNKNEEFSSTILRPTVLRFSTTDNTKNKIDKELTSKPSKLDRKKLLEKFERILNTEEKTRRECGGADFPRPWEQLVKRSIESTEKKDHEDHRIIQSPRVSEKSNVLSRFNPTDAYDRFRGTLQDTLSRRENPNSQFNNVKRFTRPGICACCVKHFRIVQRRNLLPDIPCPPTPPPPISLAPPAPPTSPPLHSHTSPCYPRPTLIRQQQREQRRQRQCHPWNFRRNFICNHQPPPWTLPTLFARPSNFNASSNNNCIHCQGRNFPTANKGYSAFKQNDTIKKYRCFMD